MRRMNAESRYRWPSLACALPHEPMRIRLAEAALKVRPFPASGCRVKAAHRRVPGEDARAKLGIRPSRPRFRASSTLLTQPLFLAFGSTHLEPTKGFRNLWVDARSPGQVPVRLTETAQVEA